MTIWREDPLDYQRVAHIAGKGDIQAIAQQESPLALKLL